LTTSPPTPGWTSGPRSLRLYALDPVGVATSTPSAAPASYVEPSIRTSTCPPPPRPRRGPWTTTSFIAGSPRHSSV
jgi:hypothetical protein